LAQKSFVLIGPVRPGFLTGNIGGNLLQTLSCLRVIVSPGYRSLQGTVLPRPRCTGRNGKCWPQAQHRRGLRSTPAPYVRVSPPRHLLPMQIVRDTGEFRPQDPDRPVDEREGSNRNGSHCVPSKNPKLAHRLRQLEVARSECDFGVRKPSRLLRYQPGNGQPLFAAVGSILERAIPRTNPDDGWCAGLRKRKKRVEISIQSDNDPALGFSPCQDLLIIG